MYNRTTLRFSQELIAIYNTAKFVYTEYTVGLMRRYEQIKDL